MKYRAIILFFAALFKLPAFCQGTGCTDAITLSLNGVLRNYSTSSTAGANVLCTVNGTAPVTWFQFTTNASAECPLLNITSSDNGACEVAFYTSCRQTKRKGMLK